MFDNEVFRPHILGPAFWAYRNDRGEDKMTGYILLTALWGFNFFGFNNFGPTSGTTPAADSTYYLLLAGSTDNLTTPTGEPLEVIH